MDETCQEICPSSAKRVICFDTSSTSWYMGAKYVQRIGPRFFDMSSASGYMGANIFGKSVPDFWHDSQMDLDLQMFMNISGL